MHLKKASEAPAAEVPFAKFEPLPRYTGGGDFRRFLETIHADMKPVIEGLDLHRNE